MSQNWVWYYMDDCSMDNGHVFKADSFKQFRKFLCANLHDYKNIIARYRYVDYCDKDTLASYLSDLGDKKLKKSNYDKIAKMMMKLDEEALGLFLHFRGSRDTFACLDKIHDTCITDCTE